MCLSRTSLEKKINCVSKAMRKVSCENESHLIRCDTPPIGEQRLHFVFGTKAHKALSGNCSRTCPMALGVQKFRVEQRIISWQVMYLSRFGEPHGEKEIHSHLQVLQANLVEMNFLCLVF